MTEIVAVHPIVHFLAMPKIKQLFRVYDISWMNDEQFEDETIKLRDYKTGLMSLICALNTDLDDSPCCDAGFTEPLHL